MADLEVQFSDVLAWLHCPKASVHGYEPAFDFEAFHKSASILRSFPHNDDALRRIVPDRRRAVEWLMQTELQMLRQSQPEISPPPAQDGEWTELKSRHVGCYRANVLGQKASIYVNLPYLHAPHSTYEAVYVDPKREPRSTKEKADLGMMAAYDKEVFRAMTGKTLRARYIAPAMEIERKLRQPEVNFEGLLHLIAMAPAADPIRPGTHCEEKIREGGSFRWRCPLREAGQCNPFARPEEESLSPSIT
jgi:hypothetical protein